LLAEDAVLFEQVVDDLLLLAVDPAGEEEQEELKRGQRVHGGSIAQQGRAGQVATEPGRCPSGELRTRAAQSLSDA